MSSFHHQPVLLGEVLDAAGSPKRVLDCTLGGGGHAAALLSHAPDAYLIGIDRDPEALQAARERLAPFAGRFELHAGPFSRVANDLREQIARGEQAPLDFVLADFGVSSHQIDSGSRGFSFRADGPLDMRMDPQQGESAAELLARLDASALADILYTLGEERRSRPIARAILAARPQTTTALAAAVKRVLGPAKRGRIDPATRTFMALRMAVNDELCEIERLLALLPSLVRIDGRAALLTFHSLEDRLVKRAFVGHKTPCICPPVLRACQCQAPSCWKPTPRKGVVATEQECRDNPRARSATLRIATRVI